MTPATFTTRGQPDARQARLGYAGAPRIHRAGHSLPPSERYGARWRSLPVEGAKGGKRRSSALLTRLLGI